MTFYKHILLAVSGGIAAYKSAELVRLIRKQGVEVRVVMTQSATQFVSPLTLQTLSDYPVAIELFDREREHTMSHINLARWADALLIAPATANIIAKCCHGLADDLLSTLYLAATCPIFIAPAMNQAMWHQPATQENIQTLRSRGVHFIGPEFGAQACGEVGYGRMTEPEAICKHLLNDSQSRLNGLRVLISAGPTQEPLDPVRYITNRSSGKMGYALATAALRAGADVTLVSGPVTLSTPTGVVRINVETAKQMYDAVLESAPNHEIYIGAAAIADYTPAIMETQKIKKQNTHLTLQLEKTQDVLAAVAQLAKRPFTVGFAAETHDLEHYAQSKLINKKLDMIAANWVGGEQGGFDSDQNALQIYWANGQKILPMADKSHIAEQLLDLIADRYFSDSELLQQKNSH